MTTIRLLEWGEFLGTRSLGREIHDVILDSLSAETPVTIDFTGVLSVSWSFADECFGRLEDIVGRQGLRNLFEWSGVDAALILPTLKAVLSERGRGRAQRTAGHRADVKSAAAT